MSASTAHATLAVLDVETGLTIPILLEDEGSENISWLVEKLEKFSSLVHTDRKKKPCPTKVMHLCVGDMEIMPDKWEEKTIEYYLLFGDPWFAKIKCLPTPSIAELTQEEVSDETTAQHTIVRNVEGMWHYLVAGPSDLIPQFGDACAVGFVDLNAKGPLRLEWSKTAPKWRIAYSGLCIEGKCTNNQCEACDQMVVANFGFVDFSLVDDQYKVQCPICRHHVVAITCAFNNCKWKWNGKRYMNPGEPPERVCQREWRIADNAYHVFCPTEGERRVKWKELTVRSKSLEEKSSKCVLCMTEVSHNVPSFEELECGHGFHKHCLSSMSSMLKLMQAAAAASQAHEQSTCPQCNHNDIHEKYIGDRLRIIDDVEEIIARS